MNNGPNDSAPSDGSANAPSVSVAGATPSPVGAPLWRPSRERLAASAMEAFRQRAERASGLDLPDYDALHAWSLADPQGFWSLLAESVELPFVKPPSGAASAGAMPETRWFEGAELNYAGALLYPPALLDEAQAAIIGVAEDGSETRLSYAELRILVARIQARLEAAGLSRGDTVAAFSANVPETVALLLACAGLGVLFASCSPDFGAQAALARFSQLGPRLLFASPHYRYGGKRFDTTGTIAELAAGLAGVACVLLPYPGEDGVAEGPAGGQPEAIGESAGLGAPSPGAGSASPWEEWRQWLASGDPGAGESAGPLTAQVPTTLPLPFDEPLYVLFSSGTTGLPKALVHRAGGVLLTHRKEQLLHLDIRAGDTVFYFTTCGWMMWNWLVSALAQAATILLYDGSPGFPDPLRTFRLAAQYGVSFLGTSARQLHGLQAATLTPGEQLDLSALRTLASTGSPLSASAFDYVYRAIKPDLHLASISGGTDIVGCFLLGVPTLPVYAGELQRPGLGVDLAVLGEDGGALSLGPGELVCRQPLPSMPLAFLGDENMRRYSDAYFATYPGLWRHGDLVERTASGGFVVHGRSDATLNPGGVRIGTAELYRPLERVPEVLEAAAAGRKLAGGEEQIWLFVVLGAGAVLSAELETRIRQAIRQGASPRHLPAKVIQISQLPRTRSGKSMELALARLVNGSEPANVEVMANPEVLDEIRSAVRHAAASP